MGTTIEMNGELGKQTTLPPTQVENPPSETTNVILSEVKVMQHLPKTNDYAEVTITLIGLLLVILVLSKKLIFEKKDNLHTKQSGKKM